MVKGVFFFSFFVVIFLWADPPERPRCSVDAPCPEGLECYLLPGEEDAVCMNSEEVCYEACGSSDCLVLESYPMQVRCNDRDNDVLLSGDVDVFTVSCENDAGKCELRLDGASCQCVDGTGYGTATSSGSSGQMEVSREKCEEMLKEVCGNKAPDLHEYCKNSEILKGCVDSISFVTEKCDTPLNDDERDKLMNYEWTAENGKKVADCCRYYNEYMKEYQNVVSCLSEKTCDECFGNDVAIAQNGEIKDEASLWAKDKEDPEDAENSSSGCSLTLF